MKKMNGKKLILGVAILGIGLFSSCKGEGGTEVTGPVNPTTNTSPQNMENSEGQETAQLNPAHGLPGHRCDIPVGAPLNSSNDPGEIAPPNTPSATISPIRIDQTPKVNPPHGQPGHDCSVPVGQELK